MLIYYVMASRLPIYAIEPADILDSISRKFRGSSMDNLFDDAVWPAEDPEDWPLELLAPIHGLSELVKEAGDNERTQLALFKIDQMCFDRAARVGYPDSMAAMDAKIIQVVDVETVIAQWEAEDRKIEMERMTEEEYTRVMQIATSTPGDLDDAMAIMEDRSTLENESAQRQSRQPSTVVRATRSTSVFGVPSNRPAKDTAQTILSRSDNASSDQSMAISRGLSVAAGRKTTVPAQARSSPHPTGHQKCGKTSSRASLMAADRPRASQYPQQAVIDLTRPTAAEQVASNRVHESLFGNNEPEALVPAVLRRRCVIIRKRAMLDLNLDLEELEIKFEMTGVEYDRVEHKLQGMQIKSTKVGIKRKMFDYED